MEYIVDLNYVIFSGGQSSKGTFRGIGLSDMIDYVHTLKRLPERSAMIVDLVPQ